MAKVRKQRRLEREQHQALVLEKRARQDTRRKRRRELWRTLTLHDLRRRSTGRLLARRSRGQRAVIGAGLIAGLILIWNLIPSVALAIALTALLLLALPVFVVIAFDKRSA